MAFLEAEVGRQRGARKAELAPHGDVPQPRGGLAWLEFGVSQLGSGMDAASISPGSFSACTFESQLS